MNGNANNALFKNLKKFRNQMCQRDLL